MSNTPGYKAGVTGTSVIYSSGFKIAISQWAISCLATILVGLSDEDGNPLGLYDPLTNPNGVAMRHVYGDQKPHFPEVTLEVTLGRIQNGLGGLRLDDDLSLDGATGSGAPVYGVFMRECVIELVVRALSDRTRAYLADQLVGGLLEAYWVDPDTGITYDGAVRLWLADRGIFVREFGRPRFTQQRGGGDDDPRPSGQVYRAHLPLICDIQATWLGSTITAGPISIATTASEPGVGGGQPSPSAAALVTGGYASGGQPSPTGPVLVNPSAPQFQAPASPASPF